MFGSVHGPITTLRQSLQIIPDKDRFIRFCTSSDELPTLRRLASITTLAENKLAIGNDPVQIIAEREV